MKKIFLILISLVLMLSALAVFGSAEGENPTVTSIKILDADTQLMEINFSEPVNCKNLGYIIPVEAYPNGNRAYATLEWNGQYMYYGCVDKDGNKIGEGDESYLCVDGDNDYIYATRMVVTIGAIQNYGIFEDLSGVEFKNLLDAGAFTTPDGRMIQPDETGSLYVKFESEDDGNTTEPPAVSTSNNTENPETEKPDETSGKKPETKEPGKTDSAPATAAPAVDEKEGNAGLIIGIIAVAVVIVVAVAIVAAKKKKN